MEKTGEAGSGEKESGTKRCISDGWGGVGSKEQEEGPHRS